MRQRPARMHDIVSIGVERVGDLADSSSADLLRLENLDVDLPPCEAAIERTCRATTHDADNSYLPFVGQHRLREVAAHHVSQVSGVAYDQSNCVIAPGGLAGILNVLLATIDTANEVIVTDPTYAGLLNRIRLAGGVPKFVPFEFVPGAPWKLDRDALQAAIGPRTRGMLLMSPSMPSGGLLSEGDWQLVAELCCAHDLLLVLDAAMERLVFDRQLDPSRGLCRHARAHGDGWQRVEGTAHDWLARRLDRWARAIHAGYRRSVAGQLRRACWHRTGCRGDRLEESHASIGAYVSELER